MLKHVEIEIKYEYDIYTVAKYLLLKKIVFNYYMINFYLLFL